jgi:hypothetical protein
VSAVQIAIIYINWLNAVATYSRLRQVDVKAEHFERQVQRVEQERDMWEKKYEVRYEFNCDHVAITADRVCLTIVTLCRTLKRNIASPRQNWMNLFRTWKACDWTLRHRLPFRLFGTLRFSFPLHDSTRL